MDPLSIAASALAVITATAQTTIILCDTVKRYKERDKTLGRLQDELENLNTILKSLEAAVTFLDASMWMLLEGPLTRCGNICSEFEAAMRKFSAKPKTGLRDWTKMEFMRGNINSFIDDLASYKGTITIALGTITMNTSQTTRQVLDDYHEMIKNTVYDLQVRLQRIEDEITHDSPKRANSSEASEINLQDEKDVIKQCLRICEDAKSHLESLQNQERPIQGMPHNVDNIAEGDIEAQEMTFRVLSESRDKIAETIGRLQERLNTVRQERPEQTLERVRLQEDIEAQKKCLELCKRASEQVSFRKVHTFGEIVSERDSGQVVVTTLADFFDVKKVLAGQSSTQFVGSMTDESLVKISAHFLNESRPGAPEVGVRTPSYAPSVHPKSTSPPRQTTKSTEGLQGTSKPASNSAKKRIFEEAEVDGAEREDDETDETETEDGEKGELETECKAKDDRGAGGL